jgi:putative flippase GtrA
MQRWLKFSLVGMLGVVIQTLILELLTRYLKLNYLLAIALAVEIALLHSFFLHQKWTWKDSVSNTLTATLNRLLLFNCTVGVVSISSNLIFMKMLVGWLHLPIQLANLSIIAACSLFNFLITNQYVFRQPLPQSKFSKRASVIP